MSLAILISGGLDSAILLGNAVRRGERVHPLFVRCGLAWEKVEEECLRRYLAAMAGPRLEPLTILSLPVNDIYGPHWSVTGCEVPDAQSPDEAVFLPGRNVLLLSKAMIWCHLHRVPVVAMGSLQTNPFPDATPQFFRDFESVVNRAVGGAVRVELPLGDMKKTAVMRLGRDLPLQHTFSCIQPLRGLHCGDCNKCAERRQAFSDSELADPTTYVHV